MFKRYKWQMWVGLVALWLAMIACGGGDPETAANDEATPAATATPDVTANFTTFTSETVGVTVGYPQNWVMNESFILLLASDQALLGGATGAQEGGIVLIFTGGKEEYEGTTPLEILDTAIAQSDLGEGMAVTGQPAEVTIQGQPAALATVTGEANDGTPLTAIAAVILNGDRVAVVMAATPAASEAEFRPILEAIVHSVEVSEVAIAAVPSEAPAATAMVEPTAEPTPMPTAPPTEEPTPTPVTTGAAPIRQWASQAQASSQYSNPSWSAAQASGQPDTPDCGDHSTAWAAGSSTAVEWLELYYDTPVNVTAVNIVQTYNPDQVVEVQAIDLSGNLVSLYSQDGAVVSEPCPYTLAIEVEQSDFLVQGVRITVDQSIVGSWNEIDAVELVGIPGEGEAIRPEATVMTFDAPNGFRWRLGGVSGISADQYASLGGMDADSDGFLYMSDNTHGIWKYDPEGNLVALIEHNEFNNPTDVTVGPNGNLYVASWGNNSIFVLDAGGNILTQFGEEGTGPGQFGTFSPQSVAVDAAGLIYVLDDNEDAAGNELTRVQVFDANGNYQREFIIAEEFFSAAALAYSAQTDHLYVLGFIGGYILEYDLNGNVIASIGEDALDFTGPQDLDIDEEGNFYVSVWTPAGVVKLDPAGNLVSQWGVEIEDSSTGWPEGGFYQTGGVAVAPDGSAVYANDWSGGYAYLTAFEFR